MQSTPAATSRRVLFYAMSTLRKCDVGDHRRPVRPRPDLTKWYREDLGMTDAGEVFDCACGSSVSLDQFREVA